MYLCGHPGTGKTSALNSVLSRINKDNEDKFELFMYNAMTFNDVKTFGIKLLKDLQNRLDENRTKPAHSLNRAEVDDEDLAFYVAKELGRRRDTPKHKIIVIDEVDQFQSNEKAFTFLVKAMLRGTKKSN